MFKIKRPNKDCQRFLKYRFLGMSVENAWNFLTANTDMFTECQ